jgi:hypothetical protein
MGVANIITDNIDLSDLAVGFEPSVTTGLRLWHWTLGNAGRARKNQWTGPSSVGDAAVVGSPVYSAGSTRFTSNAAYLETPWQDVDNDVTYVFAASSPEVSNAGYATRAAICGHFAGAVGGQKEQGLGVHIAPLSSIQAFIGTTDGGSPEVTATFTRTFPTASTGSMHLYAARYQALTLRIDDLTASTSVATPAPTLARRLEPTRKFRIGDMQFAADGGRSDIALVAGFGAYLSDQQLADLAGNDIRPFLAYYGVSV